MLLTSEEMDDLANRLFFRGATQSVVIGDMGRELAGLAEVGWSVSSLMACLSHRFLAEALSKFVLLLVVGVVERLVGVVTEELGCAKPDVLTVRRMYCWGRFSSPELVGELYQSDKSA